MMSGLAREGSRKLIVFRLAEELPCSRLGLVLPPCPSSGSPHHIPRADSDSADPQSAILCAGLLVPYAAWQHVGISAAEPPRHSPRSPARSHLSVVTTAACSSHCLITPTSLVRCIQLVTLKLREGT